MDHTDRAAAVRETAFALAEALAAARASAWIYNAGRTAIECVGLAVDGDYATDSVVLEAVQYPQYFEALRSTRVIDASDARADERTSEFTDSYLVPLGITAMLDAAIVVGGEPVGILCVEHVGGPRRWTEAECDLVSSAAALLSVSFALEREHSLQDQLRQAQKMEALGLLAGGIAHDVNNVLSVIVGEVDLLAGASGDEVTAGATAIRGAAAQAARLVKQLLTFSRQRPVEMRPVDLGEVVRGFEPLARRALGESISVSTYYGTGPHGVLGDPAMLEQVLLNLAVNAREAMPQGGEFSISVDLSPPGTASPDAVAGYVGPMVRVIISDTGIGMPADTVARIWEPFFTTRELGSGLGLSIVHGAVRQMRGSVTAESALGLGTRFTFLFPMAELTAAAQRRITPPESAVTLSGTVLLAEDDPQVRAVLATLLRRFGMTVVEAENGERALHAFSRHPAGFDLLVSDVAMPRLDGVSAYRKMRALRTDLPALFLTGYAPEAAGLDSLLAEGSSARALGKPVKRDDLHAAVAALLPTR